MSLCARLRQSSYFNSRPSARGDLCGRPSDAIHTISIHAPPRGATTKRWRPWVLLIFQFTPLREGRHYWAQLDGRQT